jgi:hypothetical protein
MPADYSQIGPFLVAALVVFAVYRRLRRSFGRQPLQVRRLGVRMALLAVAGSVLVPVRLQSGQLLVAEVVGALLGVALAVWGASRTRFEMHDGRLHYVPHTYTGIAVSLLFLGRLSYRAIQVYLNAHGAAAPPAQFQVSPLTVGIFFVMLGYYLYYYGWLLWKSKKLNPADLQGAAT